MKIKTIEKIISILIVVMILFAGILFFIPTEQKINLDNNKINEIIEDLSLIVHNSNYGTHYGIYKGRWFGTPGENYAADLIKNWMEEFSSNLSLVRSPTNEKIQLNKKTEVRGFGVKLKDDTSSAIISNNESFVVPKIYLGAVGKTQNYSDNNVIIKKFPLNEELNEIWSSFNISYVKLGESNFSDIPFYGQLSYCDDCLNITEDEISMKVLLINVSDVDFNLKINYIAGFNSTGFILTQYDQSKSDISTPLIAISNENWSLLYDLLKVDNQIVFISFPYDTPIPDVGNITVSYLVNPSAFFDDRMYLIDQSNQPEGNKIFMEMLRPHVKGILWFDSNESIDKNIHLMIVPNGIEGSAKEAGVFSLQVRSCWPKPIFFINRTIIDENGLSFEIDEWVNQGNLKADFWVDMKHVDANSFNVYCTVKGNNSNKRVIISGGHYDGMWGEMTIDNAAGVGIMLGILKYFNDNKIEPTYDTTFITFSGEEWIDRGARSYILKHYGISNPRDIEMIINLDVLAYKNCDTLVIQSTNRKDLDEAERVKEEIRERLKDFQYDGIIKYNVTNVLENVTGGDAFPFWFRNVPVIAIEEEDYMTIRHKTGSNHSKGDVLEELEFDDLNATAGLVLEIVNIFNVVEKKDFTFISIIIIIIVILIIAFVLLRKYKSS